MIKTYIFGEIYIEIRSSGNFTYSS